MLIYPRVLPIHRSKVLVAVCGHYRLSGYLFSAFQATDAVILRNSSHQRFHWYLQVVLPPLLYHRRFATWRNHQLSHDPLNLLETLSWSYRHGMMTLVSQTLTSCQNSLCLGSKDRQAGERVSYLRNLLHFSGGRLDLSQCVLNFGQNLVGAWALRGP